MDSAFHRKPSHKKIFIGHKKKIAFVCSGGAAKAGAFHLGVALALREQGFNFFGGTTPLTGVLPKPGPMGISTYVGSSAGSMIATFLAAGYSLENIFNSAFSDSKQLDPADAIPKILPRLTYQKMFKLRSALAKEQVSQLVFLKRLVGNLMAGDWEALLQFRWLRMQGLFSTAGIEQYMREDVLVSNRFQDYISDLFIVATQLNHSRKVVFGKYSYKPPPHDLTCQYNNDVSISEAVASSTALPFIFAPYAIKNQNNQKVYYIDGEIRDTLSTHVAIDAGCDLVIASHTHQPYHFRREVGSLTDYGIPAILVQSIYLLIEQKINNHIHSKQVQRNALNAVDKYCKEQNVSSEHREKIMQILENELYHRRDVDMIYIHPSPSDSQMFFGEHFTLSPKKLTEVVKSGFKAAIHVLRKYDFADRAESKPATGTASVGVG